MRKPSFALIKTLWHYGQPWRWGMVGYGLTFVIAQVFASLEPWAFGHALNALQKNDPLQTVIFWLFACVGLSMLFWVFHGPARVLERRIAMKIQQAFRLSVYQDLSRLPLQWHQDHHSGDTLTRLNRSSTALYRFLEQGFVYIEAAIQFLAAIGFLLWISVPIGLITLGAAILITLLVLIFDRRIIPLYDTENAIESRVGALLYDYVSTMTTILTLRLAALTHNSLMQRIMSVWPSFRKETVLNEAKWCTMKILLSITQAVVLTGYVFSLTKTGDIVQIGLIVMVFRYQHDMNNVFNDLSHYYGEIVRMNADVQMMQPIIEDIKRLAHTPKGIKTAQQWHTLSVRNLTFCHDSQDTRYPVLDQISFDLKRGERIALLGVSGGGKSTLLNLLCGLYEPHSVMLQIDDVMFDTLEPLRSITTLIPQDPEIFENTIAFNITLDLPTNEASLDHAIQMSGFRSVLKNLPHGLETDIREKGLNLSVGQKQRLALARGLFAAQHSSMILMDEPTSSVDFPTEKKILTQVMKSFSDATLIISLHRLHLLPLFDRVLMLEQGRVTAFGPVIDLLDTPGPVRDLYQAGRHTS